ncbi:MAG: RNA-binding protein [Dehalococcoidia bacterium]
MTTLFVGNLSPEMTENDLRNVFEAYGKVSSLRYVSRRGIAYVDLDPDAANAAVDALRGVQLKGRTIDVVLDQASGGRPGRRRGKGRR